MKMLLVMFAFMSVQFSQAATPLLFTSATRVKDEACCGDRISTVSFDYVYLKANDGRASARVSCTNNRTFSSGTLTVLVVMAATFNVKDPSTKRIETDLSPKQNCETLLLQFSKISDANPYVVPVFERP